jgi:hypothetical protein
VPTDAQIQRVVETVFSGLSGFLANPTDYIWEAIINGTKARFRRLGNSVLESL